MKTRTSNHTISLIVAVGSAVLLFLPGIQAVSPPPDGGYAGNNTAEGTQAFFSLTSGVDNAGLGFQVLYHNTTGNYNTAEGFRALFSNTNGAENTAQGFRALFSNTSGDRNTANGLNALTSNTTGNSNTAVGDSALFSNAGGAQNTASGDSALFANTEGSFNTATGVNALAHDNTGGNNTANGHAALFSNTSGSNNVAIGRLAGSNLTTGDNNIDIGYNVNGGAGEANTIRIGNTDITDTFIRGISGATAAGGAAVFVASNGHLGTTTSSARFKDEIKPMGNASEAILALRPVSFHYKKEIDPQGIPEFGLIAEEVEKVNPALVIHDPEGRPYTVRYEQVNAMLLNEFLKQHRKVQEQEVRIARQEQELTSAISQQRREIDLLTARLKEQDSQIQKMSAQLGTSKPVRRVAVNN
ncbi:MAG TPA: tail fiber domain-containing protein [Candidatus Udaeobacter sp.]|jgi:hypothetical protein|nr:tail fiber domain-containing protein [Candidatus Udaeobacter sp.]